MGLERPAKPKARMRSIGCDRNGSVLHTAALRRCLAINLDDKKSSPEPDYADMGAISPWSHPCQFAFEGAANGLQERVNRQSKSRRPSMWGW